MWWVVTTIYSTSIFSIIIIIIEDEEYCRIYDLFEEEGVCVEEGKAGLLMREAQANSRVAWLDRVENSLRQAPLCPQSGGPVVYN